MNAQTLLEEKRVLLRNELDENLQKKHVLQLRINRQFEKLKRLEISMEKHAHTAVAEE